MTSILIRNVSILGGAPTDDSRSRWTRSIITTSESGSVESRS